MATTATTHTHNRKMLQKRLEFQRNLPIAHTHTHTLSPTHIFKQETLVVFLKDFSTEQQTK
jgi:hypothetical protein